MELTSELILGDCLAHMKKYPNDYFDLAVVDPPYGINATNMNMGGVNTQKGGNISTAMRIKKGRLNTGSEKVRNRILNKSDIDWDNDIPSPEYFKELFRISKHQIIFGGNYFKLPPTRCIICWDKRQPWKNFSQWEMAWTSFDKPAVMYRISNTGGDNHEKKIHPTQKPVRLYDNIFRDFATKGMKVLDTHVGSGSSRISASKAKLHFIGFEKDEQYYNDSIKRFELFEKQLRLF